MSTDSASRPDRHEHRAPKAGAGSDRPGGSQWFTDIINAVRRPISFFVLTALVVVVAFPLSDEATRWGLLGLLVLLVATVSYMTIRHADVLIGGSRSRPQPPPPAARAGEDSSLDSDAAVTDSQRPPAGTSDSTVELVRKLNEDIYGARSAPPDLAKWYRDLQPTLHQAPFYTVPTYFLDRDLYVLDYNIAFELVFASLAGTLRGRHVNWLIAQLHNHDEVHEHGRAFTERVLRENYFPLIDLEPIVYDSAEYGRAEFVKIASQLHDANGRLQGWSVALMPKKLKWQEFEAKLARKLRQEKLWSIYSGSYDRILTGFPPYHKLIADVIGVIPGENCLVADLGAGTGNVTAAILRAGKGHRVVAIENNVGMLDLLRTKDLSATILKDSIENCERLKAGIFDAVIMVNVLYAVDDPLACLEQVRRLLRPNGVVGLSTTHRETNLDELLGAIKAHLVATRPDDDWQDDYRAVEKVNREIETSIARRHTRAEYQEYLRLAGFELLNYVPSTYHNAVLLMHATKKRAARPN